MIDEEIIFGKAKTILSLLEKIEKMKEEEFSIPSVDYQTMMHYTYMLDKILSKIIDLKEKKLNIKKLENDEKRKFVYSLGILMLTSFFSKECREFYFSLPKEYQEIY